MRSSACPVCNCTLSEILFSLSAPPPRETRFPSLAYQSYSREIHRCLLCGHCVSLCQMDTSRMYCGEYVSATYADAEGVRRNFERIINLPALESDNVARVKRVLHLAREFFGDVKPRRLLDIGSGLAVFPYEMKLHGWDSIALDPDPSAAEHARVNAGVQSICGDFLSVRLDERYPLVTLNKVLEHVTDPVIMLERARHLLDRPGFLYIEVPDAAAASGGSDREEFFIEHLHIFSARSLTILVSKAGLRLIQLQRVREASDKYTLCAAMTNP